MAEKSWYVSKDGTQIPGEMDTSAVRAFLAAEPGHAILVWSAGMANWAPPSTLPEFASEPAAARPAPGSAPSLAAARPAPRPAIPAGVPTKAELQEHAGALRSLFDLSFENLITMKIVKAVYLVFLVLMGLGVVLGVLGGLAGAFAAFSFSPMRAIGGLVVALVVIPLAALIYLAMIRVFLEVTIVMFRIKDDVHKIAASKP